MITPLYPRFNELVLHIVDVLMPQGYDCTDMPTECDTLEKVRRWHMATGRVLVWTGASDRTIFGDAGVNHAARAWHDFVHVVFGLPFTPEGEHLVMKIQQRHVYTLGNGFSDEEKELFCRILEAEVDGLISYYTAHGHFPEDQRAFVERYLAA